MPWALFGSFFLSFLACAEPNRPVIQSHQFKALKGKTIENHDGEKLGCLKDFILDTASGRVEYALIKSSGPAPFVKERIVPGFCLSLSSVKKDTLALDVTNNRWDKAPTFNKRDLATLGTPMKRQEIAGSYHIITEVAGAQKLSPTGTSDANSDNRRKLVLASDLIGQSLLDSAGHPIGKISDVLVDTSSRGDTFVLFSARASKSTGTFAIALRSIQSTGRTLALPANQTDLAAAPPFDWPNVQPGQIYRCGS
jgi:sporulation protein YlmC with PRC-barrel domain